MIRPTKQTLRLGCLLTLLCVFPAVHAGQLPGYSWLELSGGSGQEARLDLSYALSPQAFMYAGEARDKLDGLQHRRGQFGVGISTDPAAGYVLYATAGWNNIGLEPEAAAGQRAHGFDVSAGLRVLLSPDWETYARVRYTHSVLPVASSDGAVGIRFLFTPKFALGLGVDINADQTAWLLSLRWYY